MQEEKNYRESLTHCRIRGGMLAMPKDEAANTLLADYVSKSGFFRVFIGVNDLEREGQYVFTDNTPLRNYSNWKEGEPSDPYGQEDCVEMLSSGRWNDTECHLTMYFVCEFIKKKKWLPSPYAFVTVTYFYPSFCNCTTFILTPGKWEMLD